MVGRARPHRRNSPAQTVIGSWQTGQAEGWYDSSNGKPITDPANAGKYSFVPNAVPGYAHSLQITDPSWTQTSKSISTPSAAIPQPFSPTPI